MSQSEGKLIGGGVSLYDQGCPSEENESHISNFLLSQKALSLAKPRGKDATSNCKRPRAAQARR